MAAVLRKHSPKVIAIVGGSGFIGRAIARKMVADGHVVRIIARHPENALQLKTAGDPGQVVLMRGDLLKPATLKATLTGVDVVVNLVGVLYEKGGQRFAAIHAKGAETLAKIAKESGVKQFIHMSALGVDQAGSAKYARTKLTGEKAVRAQYSDAVILRPSIVFGAEDNFFNQFGNLATISPFLPLVGGGQNKFQPVHVEDVAEGVRRIVANPESFAAKTYSLGGPDVVTFEQIMHFINQSTGRNCLLVPLPFALAKVMALFLELLPRPLLTRDQVRLLKVDNVVPEKTKTFKSLGIQPQSFYAVVPHYLKRFKPYLSQAIAR